MFKKLAIGTACILTVSAAAALSACGEETDYDDKYADRVKVVYELEGGKYLNSTTSVSHYYEFKSGAPRRILPLEDKSFSEGGVTRDGGFVLDGWYRTKTVEGEAVEYSDRWNFETDVVADGGVTLYAKWNSPIVYSFDFVYTDANGVERVANSYKVNEGNTFGDVWQNDVLTYANGYAGHTAVAVYYDPEHKIPFDDSVRHPGGEESTAVKLYVEYIEGSYTIVRTAAQLKAARSRNIYLLADIDMEGKPLSFTNFNGKTFIGNGHTVSNFTLEYGNSRYDLVPDFEDEKKKALCVALFGNAENVTVKDVSFENVTVTVDTFLSDVDKIYVAPLAVSAKNSTFENVSVAGTFGATDRTTAQIIYVTDRGTFVSEGTSETGCDFGKVTVKK